MRHLSLFICAALLAASCQESWQKRLERETRLISLRQCPHYITEGLIADSMAYVAEENARYDYLTLVDSLIDISLLDGETAALAHRGLVDQIRQSVELRTLKEHGATFRFIYRLQSTGEVAVIDSVTAGEYK